jgi:E3 ubiquitin-protein ligase DOA10
MENSYFFDKRRLKRGFAKYGIIFLISFFPLVLFNIYVGNLISANWVVVFLDCVILLIFVCIGNAIANRIFEKKDAKRDARIRAREELNLRKKQILEDSYRRKRQEKINKKNEENVEDSGNMESTKEDSKDNEITKNVEVKKSTRKGTRKTKEANKE